ncbi:MAG: nitrate reductase [Planctomycetota bacterium]
MTVSRREFIKTTAAATAAAYIGLSLSPRHDALAQSGGDAERWVRGTCRLCGVGCRVELGLEGGKPVALRGVPGSRTNLGYLCMKGMLFYRVMAHPDRLVKPLYRAKKSESFKEISWDEALDIAAKGFADSVKAKGNDSVAYYGSGQALTEETYLFQKVMRGGLQTNNVEGNPRLCMASAVGGYLTSFGADEPIGGYANLEQATCFFLIGSNMSECHPVLFRRVMRRKLDNPDGVKVINADPRVSATSRIADLHLAFKPGSDLAMMNAMARVILDEKLHDEAFIRDNVVFRVGKDKKQVDFETYRKSLDDYTPEKAAEICGGTVTADDIRKAARWFAKSNATMSLWTMGINQRRRGVWANNLIHNLHLLTGQLLKPGADSFSLTGQPNACGGVREGGGLCHILPGHRLVAKEPLRRQVEKAWGIPEGRIPPKPGYHTMALFSAVNDGKIGALWVNCTNPVQSLPNMTPYREGMAREDVFIVVTDIFPTRTTEVANLVLPTAFHFEKTGVYGCTERRSQITPKAVDAPGEAKPETWIVTEWARRLAKVMDDPVIEQCVKPFMDKDPDREQPKAIWDEYTQKLTAHRDNDLRGATYEVLDGMDDGVQWPAPTEEFAKTGGTVMKFVKGIDPMADSESTGDGPYEFYGPAHADRKLWVWIRPHEGADEEPDEEYPMYFSTGRIIDHWHTGTMTMRVPELLRANPYSFVEVNPADAKRLGIRNRDMVEIESRRGKVVMPAKVKTGPIEGMVFAYWHDMGEDRMVNKVCKDAIDPGSKEPEFKICACRIRKVSGPTPIEPVVVQI